MELRQTVSYSMAAKFFLSSCFIYIYFFVVFEMKIKEVKDPYIRLFGKKIALLSNAIIFSMVTAENWNGGWSLKKNDNESDCVNL